VPRSRALTSKSSPTINLYDTLSINTGGIQMTP
jgi:hypothetical protein